MRLLVNLEQARSLATVRLCDLSITAIAQPIEKIAEKLITLLLGRLTAAAKTKTGKSFVLPAELVIRNSSKIVHKGK